MENGVRMNKLFFVIFLSNIQFLVSFNLFPSKNVYKGPNSDSYFGFSVQLRSSSNGQQSRVIVGAPRANSSHPKHDGTLAEPGAVYSCSLDTLTCHQYLFDPEGNVDHPHTDAHLSYHHMKDHGWLGATVDGDDAATGLLVACAPRWINTRAGAGESLYYHMKGLCYLLESGSGIESEAGILIPLVNSKLDYKLNNGGTLYYYFQGEAGLSLHFQKDTSDIIIGAPGVAHWRGAFIKYSKQQGGGIVSSAIVPDTYLGEPIGNYSYFGYAVSSGRFKHDTGVWYVGGAPRGKNLKGQIFVYELNQGNELVVHFEAHGRQMGEYFGSALAVADVNGDTVDDILVGAPMYSSDNGADTGCLYVYIADGKGGFARSAIDGPRGSRARFGTAVSSLGDINKDGCGDIAVGAPYHQDGRGAVFIYLGSRRGLRGTHSQLILAEAVDPQLRAFGASISRGLDIDGNRYNDVAVGAFVSGHVVILKTRPIMNVSIELSQSGDTSFNINTTSIKLTACLRYTGQFNPDSLKFLVSVNASGDARVSFHNSNRWTEVTQYEHGVRLCRNISCRIKNNNENALHFVMTYALQESSADKDGFCSTCPVDNVPATRTANLKIAYNNDCRGVCKPDLKLFARFKHDNPTWVIGSNSTLDMEVEFRNAGDPAYMCKLNVQFPVGLSPARISDKCKVPPGESVMECDLGEPVIREKNSVMSLSLDVTKLKMTDSCEVRLNVTSSGIQENSTDRLVVLRLPLESRINLDILNISAPEIYVRRNEEVSVAFSHKIKVINQGPSPADRVEFTFSMPRDVGNRQFLQVHKPTTVTSRDNVTSIACTTDARGFYGGDGEDGMMPSGEVPPVGASTTLMRDGAVAPPFQDDVKWTLELSCDDPEIGCMSVRCVTGPLERDDSNGLEIEFKMVANLAILGEDFAKKNVIISTRVMAASEYLVRSQSGHVRIQIEREIVTGRFQDMWLWIVIGVATGTSALAAMMFCCWKFGFFRHKKYSQLKQAALLSHDCPMLNDS